MNWSTVKSIKITEGDVKSLSINSQVVWKKEEVPVDPPVDAQSFRFENKSNSGVTVSSLTESAGRMDAPKLKYSKDGKSWTDWNAPFTDAGYELDPVKIDAGEILYVRGYNPTLGTVGTQWHFTSTGELECNGSLESLVNGEVVDERFPYILSYMPLTTLPNIPNEIRTGDLSGTFSNNPIITQVPPMSFKFAPGSSFNINGLFSGCTNITTVGPLTFESSQADHASCTVALFRGCSKLNSVSVVASTWDAKNSERWLEGVATTGNIIAPNLTFEMLPESVDGCPTGWTLNGEARPVDPPVEDHRFRFYNPGEVVNTLRGSGNPIFETSADGVNWTPAAAFTSAEIQPKGTLYLRGRNANMNSKTFRSTQPIECHGSIMDLCDGGTGTTTIQGNYKYLGMFKNMETLTTAPELPATTLAPSCYSNMFEGCTSLTTTPELPATTLAPSCYSNMFQNCTKLNKTPELPATTLAPSCYISMFEGCTSLTTTPELPATTLANYCYNSMFYGCSSLTTTPELPATKLTDYCYSYMFGNCTSLTTAPELPATTLAPGCYNGMFYGCSSLTTTPELPATKLTDYCYSYMFGNCTSLTTAPELPATRLVKACYEHMFMGCSIINTVKVGTVTWNIDNTKSWLEGVATTGTFVKPAALQIGTGEGQIPENSIDGIPTGWTTEDIEPVEDHRFRFKNVSGAPNTVKLVAEGSAPQLTLEKSSDGKAYIPCDIYAGVELAPGETIYLKGTNKFAFASDGWSNYNHFTSTGNVECHGSVCDLIDNGTDATSEIRREYQFGGLFRKMTTLLTAPELPFTYAVTDSCSAMFEECSSLEKAPIINIESVFTWALWRMFTNCSKLNYIEVRSVSWYDDSSTEWVEGVSPTGTFVKPADTSIVKGVDGIPTGWTVENV